MCTWSMNKSVEDVIRMAGLRFVSKTRLQSSPSSEVWFVRANRGNVVVRFLGSKNGFEPRIAFEATVRRRLHDEGIPVAKVIATSQDFSEVTHSRPWIIDEHLLGKTHLRGKLPNGICADLANVLIHLHDIEGHGFGRAEHCDELRGIADSIEIGLATRFDNPWPLGSLTIDQHPISQAGKRIGDRLRDFESKILEHLHDSPSRVVHSDLHEGQMICCDSQLAGLIDFGDSMLADPAWDFASLYYFHGDRVLDTVISTYEPKGITRTVLAQRARLFSICIACHHATRSKRLAKPHRMDAAITHLHRVLCLAGD